MRHSDQHESVGIKAAHIIFFAQLAVFLVLVVGSGSSWHAEVLGALSLSAADGLLSRPWTLITYSFLNAHPLEFIVTGGVMLLAGVPIERRLGSARFCVVYLLGSILVGLAHVALVESGLTGALLFQGSVGTCAGLLSAYLFLFGHERRVGSVPYPIFYLVLAGAVFAVLLLVGYDNNSTLERRRSALIDVAAGPNASIEEKVAAVYAVDALEAQRADSLGHMLGFALGALALLLSVIAARTSERYRMHREIRGLQEEVDARARVEDLLAKISQDGMGSLSRHERKFLRYASRFYRLSKTRG